MSEPTVPVECEWLTWLLGEIVTIKLEHATEIFPENVKLRLENLEQKVIEILDGKT